MNPVILHPPMLSGAQFDLLRQNPDRGWRLETYLTLGSNTVMFKADKTPLGFLDEQRELYREIPCHLVQFYVYLTEYCKKPLDETAFSQFNTYLSALRERNLRAVLRFAYEFEVNRKTGPTSRRIYQHLRQIKAWFAEHPELVSETVLVVQAGVIGAWGEWHTARFPHNQKKTLLKICDAVPQTLPVQVRMQSFKDKIRSLPQAQRVGYHDDFLVGAYHKWNTPAGKPGTTAFERFQAESRLTLNDGEMPWGRDKTHQNGFIDGYEMLTACAQRSLSTLSLVHNFIEEDGRFNAVRWQSETLTAERAKALGCPFASEYFQTGERTVFDYLTDHLGYQIALRKIEIADSEHGMQKITLTLENNGFALPYGFSDLSLHIKLNDGTAHIVPFADFTPEKLLGGETVSLTVQADLQKADQIGVSLQKPLHTPLLVRFANSCDFADGIHWFDLPSYL